MAQKSFFLLSTLIYVLGQYLGSANEQTIDTSRSGSKSSPRLFSVKPSEGNVDINLDVSVPFISLPLEQKMHQPGMPMSLFNINPKGLAIFGTLLVVTAVVVPLFAKNIQEDPTETIPGYYHHRHYGKEHKKRDRSLDFWIFDESINEILSRDGPVTPCVQRVVCTAVATASRSYNQTSADKIIDGLSSNMWFKQATNGTSIEEAISTGRNALEVQECNDAYKNCALNEQILTNLFKIIGI